MTNKTKNLVKGVNISCITVSDLKKAKHFFSDLLGLEVKKVEEKYNWMELGGKEGGLIGVGQPSSQEESCGMVPGSNAIICIDVENIEESIAHLKEKGVKFIGEITEVPGEVKMILFEDFDGNRFFLCEPL